MYWKVYKLRVLFIDFLNWRVSISCYLSVSHPRSSFFCLVTCVAANAWVEFFVPCWQVHVQRASSGFTTRDTTQPLCFGVGGCYDRLLQRYWAPTLVNSLPFKSSGSCLLKLTQGLTLLLRSSCMLGTPDVNM
jgi:hypothetical protein